MLPRILLDRLTSFIRRSSCREESFPFSKSLSELPVEILLLIFNMLYKDTRSLHSCLVLNSKLCCVIVRILYRNVFNRTTDKRRVKLVRTLLHSLNKEERNNLSRTELKELDKGTLIPYLTYITELNIHIIYKAVAEWVDHQPPPRDDKRHISSILISSIIHHSSTIHFRISAGIPAHPFRHFCFPQLTKHDQKLRKLTIERVSNKQNDLSLLSDIISSLKSLESVTMIATSGLELLLDALKNYRGSLKRLVFRGCHFEHVKLKDYVELLTDIWILKFYNCSGIGKEIELTLAEKEGVFVHKQSGRKKS
ncbi:3586_t:CDS:1 [Paraglomus brasilianum]|uniref:3586_t:CDS:1 n=1 Tax=Paraglomus brasilianum TaxID=144538 RepID=A0A9N9F5J3_9GLOM|nr:3586_t:CDS:1 [Paraglomus brasilianum]